MGFLSAKTKGRADGRFVSQVVTAALANVAAGVNDLARAGDGTGGGA
jgi:hypothetical protein